GVAAPLPGGSGLVVLDTDVTAELADEGLVRDLVRVVQQARRDADLDVADRIALVLGVSKEVERAARAHEEFVASETLAATVSYEPTTGFEGTVGDGVTVNVLVAKI
ncbi:DUF5915 domain-containing protein, partial [Kibdelosporangium lantanae]